MYRGWMKQPEHHSADAFHYDTAAKDYDAFNEQRSKNCNQVIESILKQQGAQSVLDLSCGTGSQVFWLASHGYDVVGMDISAEMLKIAKAKTEQENRDFDFRIGDMSHSKVGEFDAVLTIFNAIGHLTKDDFEKAVQNIHSNLKDGGIYIFDIFNLNYLLDKNNITKLTIDWQEDRQNKTVRYIQYSTINKAGVLASYTHAIEDSKGCAPQIRQDIQTLQTYTAEQLIKILEKNNFKVVNKKNVDGSTYNNYKTERFLIVAQK